MSMAAARCLALAAVSSITPQERGAFGSGQVWAGNYTCAHVPAWLLLHVIETARIRAVFHFVYPHSGTHGAFIVEEGDEPGQAGDLQLDASVWIHRPRNAEMVGIVGRLSKDHARMEGKIVHDECGRFELTRTVVDVVDSAVEHAMKTSEGYANAEAVHRPMAVMQYAYDQLERRLASVNAQHKGSADAMATDDFAGSAAGS